MFKELLHKLSYRKIEIVSRIDEEKMKILMELFNNKNIKEIWIQEKLYLSRGFITNKNKEKRTTEVDIRFKPFKNLAQYRNNMMCIKKLNLPFEKRMSSSDGYPWFSCDIDDVDWDVWMYISHDIEEEKRMELLGDIMGCEIIKTTNQYKGYTTESFACKNEGEQEE